MPLADPASRRAYQRKLMRKRRAAERAAGAAPRPASIAWTEDDAAAVVRLLEEQVEAVRADGALTSVERARTVGYLANVVLRAVDVRALMPRLEALEAELLRRVQA